MKSLDTPTTPIQIVNEQAEDEGLWFMPQYASEAYLQAALRRLHEAVEGKSKENCALEALDVRAN
jgi:hypothetical protein